MLASAVHCVGGNPDGWRMHFHNDRTRNQALAAAFSA